MGRTAKIGLFVLMGLVIALARLVEVEVARFKPGASVPLDIASSLTPKPLAPAHDAAPRHARPRVHAKLAPAPASAKPVAPPPAKPGAAPVAPDVAARDAMAEWPRGPVYVVKKGETLADIAKKGLGTSHAWQRLYTANADRLQDPKSIRAGTRLAVPVGHAARDAK